MVIFADGSVFRELGILDLLSCVFQCFNATVVTNEFFWMPYESNRIYNAYVAFLVTELEFRAVYRLPLLLFDSIELSL